jgi:hypothetical protein
MYHYFAHLHNLIKFHYNTITLLKIHINQKTPLNGGAFLTKLNQPIYQLPLLQFFMSSFLILRCIAIGMLTNCV